MSRGPQRVAETDPLPTVIETGASGQFQHSLKSCRRCGAGHPDLTFRRLDNSTDIYNWWSVCPTTSQPVLIKVTEPEQA
jgi:hypothetical protein